MKNLLKKLLNLMKTIFEILNEIFRLLLTNLIKYLWMIDKHKVDIYYNK